MSSIDLENLAVAQLDVAEATVITVPPSLLRQGGHG
jgi:hypothetical protein